MIRATATWEPGDYMGVLDRIVAGRVVPAVDRSTDLVAKYARIIVAVDTGELRDSTHAVPAEIIGMQVVGAVEATAGHAPFIEFGTYKMAAQPFLRPSLDVCSGAILEEFER